MRAAPYRQACLPWAVFIRLKAVAAAACPARPARPFAQDREWRATPLWGLGVEALLATVNASCLRRLRFFGGPLRKAQDGIQNDAYVEGGSGVFDADSSDVAGCTSGRLLGCVSTVD